MESPFHVIAIVEEEKYAAFKAPAVAIFVPLLKYLGFIWECHS